MNPLTITEPAILLCINHTYKAGVDPYDAARGVWALSERRLRAELAFGIYQGRIMGVYRIQKWHRAGSTPYVSGRLIDFTLHPTDWEFTGIPATKDIWERYVGQPAPRLRGPARYVNI